MATSEPTVVGAQDPAGQGLASGGTVGRSSARKVFGLIGQYATLSALALIVLGPLLLILIQALSPPFTYVNAGTPLHPVAVAWKDRTWWSGGPISVVGRTIVIAALFAWLQKVGAGRTWREWRFLLEPARLVAVLGGTLVLGLSTSPVFDSLHAADGRSQWLWIASMVATGATQVWAFGIDGRRGWPLAVFVGLV